MDSEGVYQCAAENKYGMIASATWVRVLGKFLYILLGSICTSNWSASHRSPLLGTCHRKGSLSTKWFFFYNSWSNWNLEMMVFGKRGNPEYTKNNLSGQRRQPTTNSTHIWHRRPDLNPGHVGGKRVLSPLRHPCFSAPSVAHV